jgi:hypothetical protein
MPSQVRKLSEVCLHDAEVLSRAEEVQAGGPFLFPEFPFPFPVPFWTAVAVVSVKRDGEILTLFYCLWDRIRVHPSPENWPSSKVREHWLYDEVDCAFERRGPFVHRILLSTGNVLEIPFASVVIHEFPFPTEESERISKQSA